MTTLFAVEAKRSLNSRLHLRYPCRDLLQTVAFGTCLVKQLIPIVGRVTAGEHLPKHPICIVRTFIATFCVLVVHPGQHDHFAGRVVAKKQAVLLEKLGSEPVLVVVAERVRCRYSGLVGSCGMTSKASLTTAASLLLAFFFAYPTGSFSLSTSTCWTVASSCARNSGCANTAQPLITKGAG